MRSCAWISLELRDPKRGGEAGARKKGEHDLVLTRARRWTCAFWWVRHRRLVNVGKPSGELCCMHCVQRTTGQYMRDRLMAKGGVWRRGERVVSGGRMTAEAVMGNEMYRDGRKRHMGHKGRR